MQVDRQIRQIIGDNIAALRKEKGLSRRAFGDALGVDQMLVYKWERGVHRPNDVNLAALAAYSGHGPAWFYTDHGGVAA
jgi:transcriptional regulator with XRE-family HTH domain